MVDCLIIVIILIVYKLFVNRMESERKRVCNQTRAKELAKKMLDRQIEILSEGDWTKTTEEIEIAKFLRDCLIPRMEKGEYSSRDIYKAHGWLRRRFKDFF